MKPEYAWPGIYPIVYLSPRGAAVCHRCAEVEDKDEIHFEGDPIECDKCDHVIQSAYGSPDDVTTL